MKTDSTLIVLCIDESGSMAIVRDATLEGTNGFIDKQRELPGEATLHLVKFESHTETLIDFQPLKSVSKLTRDHYQPGGGTALLDAVGSTIDAVGRRLAAMPESERPSKVLFAIQTDGQENESTDYTYEKVAAMIKHQTEVYKWDFIFLGAGPESISEAARLGVGAGKTLSYNSTTKGTRTMLESVGSYTTALRSSSLESVQTLGFSAEDRQKNADTK